MIHCCSRIRPCRCTMFQHIMDTYLGLVDTVYFVSEEPLVTANILNFNNFVLRWPSTWGTFTSRDKRADSCNREVKGKCSLLKPVYSCSVSHEGSSLETLQLFP